MRIAYLAAGAGTMYCGACHRDAALFGALLAAGHEVLAVPLYTPLRVDQPLACPVAPIYLGGVSTYVRQKMALPAWLRDLLDRPAFLREVSRLAVRTAPAKLGPLTVGVLAGVEGPHGAEIERLVRFLKRDYRPDIINLSNSLLLSLAGPLRAALGVPVVCTMQGEESFVEALPEPHRGQAMDLLRRHAAAVDRFVCCARRQVAAMAAWLQVPAERFAVIPTGLDAAPFARAPTRAPRAAGPAVLGYLSSIRPEKGLDILLAALGQLVGQGRDVCLAIAGQVQNRKYWQEMQRVICKAPLHGRVAFHGELDLRAKAAWLHSCDLFIMPTRLPESRAVAAMEALAAGVPVVAADNGVLPELLAQTGGGVTVPAENAGALARGIGAMLDDPEGMQRHAANGAAAIARDYTPGGMAARTIEEYQRVMDQAGVAAVV